MWVIKIASSMRCNVCVSSGSFVRLNFNFKLIWICHNRLSWFVYFNIWDSSDKPERKCDLFSCISKEFFYVSLILAILSSLLFYSFHLFFFLSFYDYFILSSLFCLLTSVSFSSFLTSLRWILLFFFFSSEYHSLFFTTELCYTT